MRDTCITVRVSRDVSDALTLAARRLKASKSDLIRSALLEYLKAEHSRQLDVFEATLEPQKRGR